MPQLTLSPTIARRLAITRQRLVDPRPAPTAAGIMDIVRDIGCLQIDPLRAVERTQYLVLWSRLGAYDMADLDTLLWKERSLFEYWAHAASIVLTEDYPLHQARMRAYTDDVITGAWGQRVRAWLAANQAFHQHIRDRLGEGQPLASKDIEDLAAEPWQSTGWSNDRNVSRMLDFMWGQGEIMVAERDGLRKKWTLTETHLPEWYHRPPLSEEEIVYHAAQKSLRALGVGTTKHIKNHFIRNRYPNLEKTIMRLENDKRILPVSIKEWPGEWYIHADDLPLLEQLQAGHWQPRTTLLSPFDNLICDRDRTELMWDFYFRIEVYVPKAKRQYGYYVLPILHGDKLIGRIDPKMDRKKQILHINAIYTEPDIPQDNETRTAIETTISELGTFLGAKEIVYSKKI
ncbi:MAG: crosslink repair DNA glycosylase YcaQ family protein [Chloroflexota bacterium]